MQIILIFLKYRLRTIQDSYITILLLTDLLESRQFLESAQERYYNSWESVIENSFR